MAISLPARELAKVIVPGSVFDVSLLLNAPISNQLKLAINLLADEYRSTKSQGSISCVARPEMFTHGRSLDWLMQKLPGVTDHFCLSDGTSVKLISGLRNHIFTYDLQSHQRYRDFRMLMRRAPEQFAQFRSQINSYHRTDVMGSPSAPRPVLLRLRSAISASMMWCHKFYLNPNSIEDSAERMLSWGEPVGPVLTKFANVIYVPLTECAANDQFFQRTLSKLIASAYFNPSTCLLIRLPTSESELTIRMRIALLGIRKCSPYLPQVRAANIFLLSTDVPEDLLSEAGSRLSLLLHETFDFWRYTEALYKSCAEINVILGSEWTRPSANAKKLLHAAFRQKPRFVLAEADRESEDGSESFDE